MRRCCRADLMGTYSSSIGSGTATMPSSGPITALRASTGSTAAAHMATVRRGHKEKKLVAPRHDDFISARQRSHTTHRLPTRRRRRPSCRHQELTNRLTCGETRPGFGSAACVQRTRDRRCYARLGLCPHVSRSLSWCCRLDDGASAWYRNVVELPAFIRDDTDD